MKKRLLILSPLILTGCLWNYETVSSEFLKIQPPSSNDHHPHIQPSLPLVTDEADFAHQGPREFYEWAAESGYPQAQEVVGLLYLYEQPVNIEKGEEYLQKAYAKNSVTAGVELAKLYSQGLLVSQNYDKALKYLEIGLKEKNLSALKLAVAIEFARDNKAKALYYLEQAAEAGDPDSKEQLARYLVAEKSGSWKRAQELTDEAHHESLYEELNDLKDFWPDRAMQHQGQIQKVVPTYDNKSLLTLPSMPKSYPADFYNEFRKAAAKGSPYAAYQEVLQRLYAPVQTNPSVQRTDILTLLNIAEKKIIPAKVLKARLILKGYWPEIKKDEALRLLNEAESAHDPYAYFALSLFARHEGNYDKSVDLFLKAKNQKNYLAAQFEIAHDLIKGDFPFWDDRIAYDWINELAQVNYNPALLMLADLKESKKILAHTEQEIFLLRLKAAWQGSVKGQYLIGNMYLKGQAVLVEPVKAFRWFNAAARGGYRPAQLQIGLMYEQGAGIIQNRAKAYAWQKISTNQLYENSNEQLHQLALSMTQEELHEALRLEQLFKQNYTYYGYY